MAEKKKKAQPEPLSPGDVIIALEEMKANVGILTEIKAQFVTAGWNEHNAERMVIAMFSKGA